MSTIRTPDDERPDWLDVDDWRRIAGGSSCRVVMYEHAGYSGGGLVEWDPVNRTSMFPYNDAVSSARRVC